MNPIAAAKRAQASALRAHADALDLEAAALDVAPDARGDDLLTRRTWPASMGCSWRVVRDAGLRGELPITRAGRTPAFKRSDVATWLAARTEQRQPAPATDEDDYQRAVRAAGGG